MGPATGAPPRDRRTAATCAALCLAAALALPACVGYYADDRPRIPPAGVEVEIAFFHDWLSPYGGWFWIEAHGWVWAPWNTPAGWHPYTYGRWIYTSFGWTWESRWVWGWGPFHYGRWTFYSPHGWVWVPGRHWAPAWVAWRHGDGWVGWAPLPPSARWEPGVGLRWDGRGPEAHWWSFVESRNFLEPQIERRLTPRPRSLTLLERTRDVTRYEQGEGGIIARGLPRETIERERGAPVPRVEVEEVTRPGEVRDRSDRDPVRVYRPPVERPAQAPGTRPTTAAPRTPEAQPPTASAAEGRRELEAWEAEQRSRLARIHDQEREAPTRSVETRELARRQEAERQELRKEVSRHREAQEDRRQRATRPSRPRTEPPARPESKPPG
jgi:hypothetical protein